MLCGMADKSPSQKTSDAVTQSTISSATEPSDALLELVRLLARQAAQEHVTAPSEILNAHQD